MVLSYVRLHMLTLEIKISSAFYFFVNKLELPHLGFRGLGQSVLES